MRVLCLLASALVSVGAFTMNGKIAPRVARSQLNMIGEGLKIDMQGKVVLRYLLELLLLLLLF